MDFIIYFCICIFAVIIFALYIRKIIKPYKQREKIESNSSSLEIKTEFETVKFQAEIVNLFCRVDMVGIKTPKTVTIYTVEFKNDDELIKLDIPQEMYDGLEIGQIGEVTLVEGKLYSFIV
ncbi:MAG: hypothetical protein IKJ27_00295 [Clostridia bacterium]|nr:hypothetical protein [Clostridia bacterium]